RKYKSVVPTQGQLIFNCLFLNELLSDEPKDGLTISQLRLMYSGERGIRTLELNF
ncbi:MAG: hypothetical protein ACI8XC_001263, partial [Gammaproteobacteria bacterium]